MRAALNELPMDGTVVIGEGERDEAPMLYIGEKVGSAQGDGPAIDIALDPLEGTTHHRQGRPQRARGAGNRRAGLPAQRTRRLYGKDRDRPGLSGRNDQPGEIVTEMSAPSRAAKNVLPERDHRLRARPPAPRRDHCRASGLGCGIKLIPDGDVAGVIATTDPDTGVDIYLGTGGAPEGVLAAAALRCVGGQMQGRLVFRNDDERARAHRWGIDDLDRIYSMEDMAKGDCIFAATGVTDGSLLNGVKRRKGGCVTTESIVMRASTGTVRRVSTEYHKPL